MKLTRKDLRKIILSEINLLTEDDETRLAKLAIKKDKNNIENIINKSKNFISNKNTKTQKKINLKLDDGSLGSIELYDPNRNLYKIKIDTRNIGDRGTEPRSIVQARNDYENLKRELEGKGKSISEFEGEFYANIIDPAKPLAGIHVTPGFKFGGPMINLKGSW